MPIYEAEHRLFQDSIKRFCEDKVLPFVDSWEEQKFFPSEIFLSLGEQGFLGMLIPEAQGGVGGDYRLAAAWCEEFGKVPAVGFTTAVNMHALVITPTLAKYASEETKARWLAGAISGQFIGAYAFTEPGAGSDLSTISAKAVRDGDDFLLSGRKIFITNGQRADYLLVLCRSDSTAGYKGFSTFVVDAKAKGFSVTKTLSKMGWHSSDTAELLLDEVRVSSKDVLGELGQGWELSMKSLNWERLMLTLEALSGAQTCLRDTKIYAQDRKVFGKPIASYLIHQETLESYSAELRTLQSLAHKCVLLLNEARDCSLEVSLLKLYACELAIKVADYCLQLHGGYGYTTEFKAERWLRDLRLLTIGGGTSQIMARIAAKRMYTVLKN